LFIVIVAAADSDNSLWHHGIIFIEAGVVGVFCSGCGRSNDGCGWFSVVAMMLYDGG